MIDTEFLKRYVDNDGCVAESMLDIDEQLTNICWLPIPNCRIEPDDWRLFWELWNKDKTYMDPSGKEKAVWESLCIWKSTEIKDEDAYHADYPLKIVDWSKHFPKMFEKIFSCMPYKEIWKVTLSSNIERVPLHVDPPVWGTKSGSPARHGTLNPWPNSLRIMLVDENTRPTFYLTPWPRHFMNKGKMKDFGLFELGSRTEPHVDDRCYVDLGKNTNTFVFSNGEFMHGADYAGKTKIVMLIWGLPDAEKWKQRLREVLISYPEYKYKCRLNR